MVIFSSSTSIYATCETILTFELETAWGTNDLEWYDHRQL